jgi:hypothetical protein
MTADEGNSLWEKIYFIKNLVGMSSCLELLGILTIGNLDY